MSRRQFELAVIGAGPAGAKAAETAARQGVRVLLVDKKSEIGSPLQCAEFVPLAVRKFAPLCSESISQKVSGMRTYINGKLCGTLGAPGYILERPVFERKLVESACEAGAELQLQARAISKTEDSIILKHSNGETEEILCQVIIGADGPLSTVGRWINSQNRRFMLGLQYRLPLAEELTDTEIFFRPEYTGGYAWLFPKGKQANVGLGVVPAVKDRLPTLLDKLIRVLVQIGKLESSAVFGKAAGLIPAGGPLMVTQHDNLILVGDAAGHTHPTSGAGIMTALICGEIAANVAVKAIAHRDLFYLTEYPGRCQDAVGKFLGRAVSCRRDWDSQWTPDFKRFEALIRRTWIGFNGKQGEEEPECNYQKKVQNM